MNSFAGCYPSGRRLRSSEPDVEPVRPVRQATAPPSPTDTSRQNSAPPSSSTDDAVTSPAEARCATFMGETVEPSDISKVLEGIVLPGPKSEFETTADYDARQAAFAESMPRQLVIGKSQKEQLDFPYDADRQLLTITAEGFRGHSLNLNPLFGIGERYYGQGVGYHPDAPSVFEYFLDRKVEYYGRDTRSRFVGNLYVSLYDQREDVGSYAAKNGFGAEAQIAQILWTFRGIYDGPSQHTSLFYRDELGTMSLAPEEARAFKPRLGIAFVVAPKSPYVMHAKRQVNEPKINAPEEVTSNITMLVADIQCALLLDGAGKVIGAYATR